MSSSPALLEDQKSSIAHIDSTRVITLQSIQNPVEDELKSFQMYFKTSMRTSVGLLDRVIRYLMRQKGKRIRPVLVLLAAKTCGPISEKSYRGAALVELLHTATLVHDDVVDDADRRRGMFSINALWKNKIAVLLGDFLLSRGLLLALDHKDYESLHALSDAVRRMSEGELLQIEKARKLDIDEDTYYKIIADKTASLISACTRVGALSASDDPTAADRMHQFGEKLGMAFQIRDDLFDYGIKDVGKPLGIDLQEKKMTLPLIFALSHASSKDKKRIMRIVRQKKKSRADVKVVNKFVLELGGIDYTRNRMYDFAEEARSILLTFPESAARSAMLDLVQFTIQRQK
ncbi:MAG: polyprenyl synthetase family protein [Rhodothermaceae bacterium]|nr:polyprenyl synthetase family protein [Rhodothermaceae bacterium]